MLDCARQCAPKIEPKKGNKPNSDEVQEKLAHNRSVSNHIKSINNFKLLNIT